MYAIRSYYVSLSAENESDSASWRFDFVVIEPSSIPSCTSVCATAGEIPDRMHVQPISFVALAILIRWFRITSYNVCYTKLLR